ncbi:hypothetical protein SNA02_02935, partial [Escherichia coli]|nr:hypothetical protein [Escherichia coli]
DKDVISLSCSKQKPFDIISATYQEGWIASSIPGVRVRQEMNIQPSSGEINAAELVSVMELKTPVVRKRKLTAVCSHQTRIGNLDAHLI